VRVPDDRTLLFGAETIDLGGVEQIASRAQMRAIGQGLVLLAARVLEGRTTEAGIPAAPDVASALDAVEILLNQDGLDVLEPRKVGNLAEFRRFELAAALNRLRTLKVE
jgi:hypothetical protein